MKNKIEETKLTPEILNALCRVCAETVDEPDFEYGEKCPRYKYLSNGGVCDHIYFFFTEAVCEDSECEFHPDNCDEGMNINRCVTCALKSGELKL